MAEPTAATTAGLGYLVIALTALAPGIDGDALIGAFAGAAVFAIHSKDLPIYKRLIYMLISMTIGYMAAGEVMEWTGLQSSALAAFVAAALVVTAALTAIDKIREFDIHSIINKRK